MAWKTSRADIIRGGFSTPLDAPMIPRFPFGFRDMHIMSVTWRTDPASIAALLPEPLQPTSDIVMMHFYQMCDTDWLGPYSEVNIMVGTELPGKGIGAYSPYLFLSSDVGVAHGREIHGQPKKLANASVEYRGDLIVGLLERNGITVATATMPYKQERGEITDLGRILPFETNFNLKAVDHIDGTPAIRQLTSRRLSDLRVRECWRGPATIELRPNAQAPVHRLPVVEMLEGFYWVADFTLVQGTVLLDYLADDGGAPNE